MSDVVQTLHDISHANFVIKKPLAKIKKATLRGKTMIKLRCTEADFECAWSFSQMPATPLVEQLKSLGFHIKPERGANPFWSSYFLYVSW